MKQKPAKRPRNRKAQNITLINEGHLKKEIAKVNRRIRALVTRIDAIEYQLASDQ